MATSKIIVALEIGTSKTCMVVGEAHPDGTSSIIGLGEVPSQGIVAGEITNHNYACLNLSDAWQLAQDHACADIQSVYLSVTGDHIRGQSHSAIYKLPADEVTIEEEHVNLAYRQVEHKELPPDRVIINQELGNFCVDNTRIYYNPVGVHGNSLEITSHTIHGDKKRLQNTLLCVRQVPLEVESMVFAPLATAQMVFGRKEREAGALLIDIGAGTTDYICYFQGNIVASGCLPYGGRTINKDIIKNNRTPMTEAAAESLKINQGHAFGDEDDTSMAVNRGDDGTLYSIARGQLNYIIRERLTAILQEVKNAIPPYMWRQRDMAVYITGGTSLMLGLDRLAQSIFKVRVYQPAHPGVGKDYTYLADPRYCTTIGLIHYAMKKEEEYAEPEKTGLWQRFLNLFRKKK